MDTSAFYGGGECQKARSESSNTVLIVTLNPAYLASDTVRDSIQTTSKIDTVELEIFSYYLIQYI